MIWSYETRNVDERCILEKIVRPGIPIIVTDLNGRIVAVNHDWVTMCKYTSMEAFGNTPKLLQGDLTNREMALNFAMELRGGQSTFAILINYKKDKSAFVNHVYGWQLGDLLVAETYAEEEIPNTTPQ